MSTEPKPYDWRTTMKKAVLTAIAVIVVGGCAMWTYLQTTGFTGTLSEILHNRVLLIAVIAAVYKAIDNWRKKSGTDGKPRWEWPWGDLLPFCLVVCSLLALTSCAMYRNTYQLPGEKKITTTVVQAYVPYPWGDNAKNLQTFKSNFTGNTVDMGQISEGGTNSAIITVPVSALSSLFKPVIP